MCWLFFLLYFISCISLSFIVYCILRLWFSGLESIDMMKYHEIKERGNEDTCISLELFHAFKSIVQTIASITMKLNTL